MGARVFRVLRIAGVALAAVVLLAVATIAWLAGTESGTRFALRRAEALLPAGFELGASSGRLADRLELAGVTMTNEGFELAVERLWLRWSPAALLSGRLDVAELGAHGVRYRARSAAAPQPAAENAEPFALPPRIALPVSVRLERASVEDVEAWTAPDAAEPLRVERVLATGVSFVDSALALEALEVESPWLSATGQASLVAIDQYPLDVALAWRARPPGYAPLSGDTTLGGSLAELAIDQRIAAPYELALRGSVRHALEAGETPTVDLALEVAPLRLREVQADLPDASVGLNARIEGALGALRIALQAEGADPEARRFTAELDALLEAQGVAIRNLAVRQPGRDGVLEGAGRVGFADEVDADLTVRWDALQWPLTGEPVVVSPRGALTVEGPPSGYTVQLDTRLEPVGAPPVDLRVAGRGDTMSAVLTLDAQERDGRLDGDIDVAWSPSVRADASLRASGFDPSPFAADWPGALDLALDAQARIDGDRIDVSLARLDAGGSLRGLPLAIDAGGRFTRAGDRYEGTIERLAAALGDTRLDVRGQFAEQAELEWRFAGEDLAALLPQAAGRLTASGRITGPIPRVTITADLAGRDLAYEAYRVASVDLRADVDSSGERVSDLVLDVRAADLAGTAVGALRLEAGGTAADHAIRVALEADPAGAELDIAGRLIDPWGASPAWQFALDDGELRYAPLAPWRLAAPATGRVDARRLVVERQCWAAADQARVCLDGRREGQGLAANIDVERFGFAYLAALLPEGFVLDGGLTATARAERAASGALEAQIDLAVAESTVAMPADGGERELVELRIEPSDLAARLDDSGAHARAALNLAYGRIDLQADALPPAADQATLAEHALDGRLEVDFPDLAFVSQFVPTVEDVRGRVGGALRLGGTLGAPAVTGALELADGSLFVRDTGITLDALTARIEGLGRDGIALAAAAMSGEGELNVDGQLSLPGDPLAARIAIDGSDFQVVDNDDARVFVSPDLVVAADAERVSITGEVRVPRAQLTPRELPPSAVAVSADQVLLSDDPQAQTAAARDLHAELRLTLGDDVHFAGFGLTSRIAGSLLVSQEPQTPTTATGEFELFDGEYRAYGQGLVIDSGRIYFAGGPITQPALDVRAVRRPREGILVGANVRGTVASPSFELVSEPSMTQQEQLSWLVLGRSLQEAPQGEGNALTQAALAMGLKGGDFLARNIGSRLGLDQVGIETGSGEAGSGSDPSEAALVVGKYLSPKLFVSYGLGLFTPESVLEMQYEISRSWRFVTQSSGDATGGDVLYTVEFGK